LYDSLVSMDLAHRSKTALARLESFKLAGIIGGALCGSLIAARLGVRMPMMLQSVPMALAAVVALTLHEPERRDVAGETTTYARVLTDGVRYFLRHPTLRVLVIDMVLISSVAWTIIWLYQPLLERAGIGLPYFGLVHAGMSLGQILVLSNVLRIEAMLGSKQRLLFAGAVLCGGAFVLLGLSGSALLTVPSVLVAASFGLARGPLFSNYMNKFIPSDKRATVLSAVSMLRTCVLAVTNPITGLLADWSVQGTMIVLGSAALLLAFVSRVEEKHLLD